MQVSDSSEAIRSRAYRQRRRDGTVIVPVEVSAAEQKALLDAHLIDPAEPFDRTAITGGIMVLLSSLACGELYFEEADEA